MEPAEPDEITLCLQQIERGDRSAVDRLLPHVYEDLRRLADGIFRARRGEQHTLQPTALVHEAYLRLVKPSSNAWRDRRHFLNVAALAMRQLLANYAEARDARKRSAGRERVLLEDAELGGAETGIDLVVLHESLARLERLDARQARIVELRFLAGLSVAEVAEVLQVTERTVYLDWRMARSFLAAELSGEGAW
jgi:RNA polymerase sigma factor (TIGR02999 family)